MSDTKKQCVKMLMGKGGIPYRHKLHPEVLEKLKSIQDMIVADLMIKPSQPVVISRAIDLYENFLVAKKANREGIIPERLALMICAGEA